MRNENLFQRNIRVRHIHTEEIICFLRTPAGEEKEGEEGVKFRSQRDCAECTQTSLTRRNENLFGLGCLFAAGLCVGRYVVLSSPLRVNRMSYVVSYT